MTRLNSTKTKKIDRGYVIGCYSYETDEIRYLTDPLVLRGVWNAEPKWALVFVDAKSAERYRRNKNDHNRKSKRKQFFISKCMYTKKTESRKIYWNRTENITRNTFVRFTKINAHQMLQGLMNI